MAYLRKWESLPDALRRVTAAGTSEEQAKIDLCNAIADREIAVRVYAKKRIDPPANGVTRVATLGFHNA